MAKSPTITDLARQLKLSPTTVSDALNGRGRIAPTTRDRVHAAARAVGYTPNTAARSLVGGRTGLLLMSLGPSAEDLQQFWNVDYHLRVMRSASATALEHSFALVLAPTHDSLLLQRIPFDGAMILDPSPVHPLVTLATRSHKPLVTIGRTEGDRSITVDSDYRAWTRKVLDHLRAGGARRPAVLHGPINASYSADIQREYLAWCADAGVQPCDLELAADVTLRSAAERTGEALRAASPPDAIVAATERLALGAAEQARAEGLRLPQDLQIVGFGDSQFAANAPVPLTMVELHPERLGAAAIETLIAATESADASPASQLVDAELVVRSSTRPH